MIRNLRFSDGSLRRATCGVVIGVALLPGSPVSGQTPTTGALPAQGAPSPQRTFDCRRRGTPGEVRHYRVTRENRALDREGRTIGWTVAEGIVERTLVRLLDEGVWLEGVRWTSYSFAEVQGSAERPEPVAHPGGAGVEFTARTGHFGSDDIPMVSSGPVTGAAGRTLTVLGLDAVTWDAMAALLREAGAELRIGTVARDAGVAPELEELPSGMSYGMGETEVTLLGLTTVKEEGAVLIRFVVEGSRVAVDADLGGSVVRIRGTEYFTGWAAISLGDGRIIEGELNGSVVSTTLLQPPGGESAELPVGGTAQRVTIREIRR